MKLLGYYTCLAAICFLTTYPSRSEAQLYVVQVGDGTASLANISTAAFVKRFATNGTLDGTLTLPTTASGANFPLTLSGSATSEGFLSLTTNGNFLTLGGYGVSPGTTNVVNTTGETVPRVAARIQLGDVVESMGIDTTTALTNTFSSNNIRSVVSVDGSSFWLTGSSNGTRYAELGSTTSSSVSSTPSNLRVAKIVDGQLYVGAASGISRVGTGLPTDSGNTATSEINTGTGVASSYDYWFKDANTVYIADDRTIANGGGIQKWTQSEDVWSLAYTLNVDAGNGLRGLTGTVVEGQTVLYATTAQTSSNRILTVTDLGAGSPMTLLATAPTNTVFRGLVFVGSESEPQHPGDFDEDGDVDGRDFLVWQRGGSSPGGPLSASDLQDWQNNYPTSSDLAAVAAVPEPLVSTLLLSSVIMMAGLRKSAASK
jgi:hypothetical protein